MLCTRILVAYDGADLSKKSLEKALEIAKTSPSIEIYVLHVMTIPAQEVIRSEAYQKMHDDLSRYGLKILSHAQSVLTSIPNKFRCFQEEGSPSHVIMDYAKNSNCDLIIMGSRGLSGFKEFLGSVSHTVVQQSPVAVLIIK